MLCVCVCVCVCVRPAASVGICNMSECATYSSAKECACLCAYGCVPVRVKCVYLCADLSLCACECLLYCSGCVRVCLCVSVILGLIFKQIFALIIVVGARGGGGKRRRGGRERVEVFIIAIHG